MSYVARPILTWAKMWDAEPLDAASSAVSYGAQRETDDGAGRRCLATNSSPVRDDDNLV